MILRPASLPRAFVRVARVIGAALLATLALGGVASDGQAQTPPTTPAPSVKAGSLVIEAPWLRATPAGAKVAAGYLKITNTGQEPDRLTGGSLPMAKTVEVHETAMAGETMKMRKLAQGLEIKPSQTVELKPGSYHLMFLGLQEAVKPGQPVKGTLTFEKAGTVDVDFSVRPIGAQTGSAMKPGDHMSHMKP
jgi:copper(I)-binding protein